MRISYVKYIKDTGEIRQWGECLDDNPIFEPGYTEGDLVILEGKGTNATHYVQLSDLAILEKPEQPSVHHVFNYRNALWELSSVKAWEAVLLKRGGLLASTDWRVVKAAETGVPVSQGWMDYRQALRDITEQADPMNIVWPQLPG